MRSDQIPAPLLVVDEEFVLALSKFATGLEQKHNRGPTAVAYKSAESRYKAALPVLIYAGNSLNSENELTTKQGGNITPVLI